MNSRFDCKPPNLPQWLHHGAKAMIFHNNVYLKGWLSYDDKSGWKFQIRRRNGEVRFKTPLHHLLTKHSTMIDQKHILPGWSNSVRQLVATARHVSANARAKARIVVLGNLDKASYTKGGCFAPVASHYAVRLITALAIIYNRILKQGDCKNAFVQSELSDLVIVRPPSDCPYSHPNTFWLLQKSLYGLKMAPRYWFNRINAALSELNLHSSPNEPCFFSGHPVTGKPPLFLVYVDDFIFFSSDDDVEKHFERAMVEKVIVDFMGAVDFFLGIRFDWEMSDKANLSVKLVQEAYSEGIVHLMGLSEANKSPKMTP